MSAIAGPSTQPEVPETFKTGANRNNSEKRKPSREATKGKGKTASADAQSKVPQASTKYRQDPRVLDQLRGPNEFVDIQPDEKDSFVDHEGNPVKPEDNQLNKNSGPEASDDEAPGDEDENMEDAGLDRRVENADRQAELGPQEKRRPVPTEIKEIYQEERVCEAFKTLWVSPDDEEVKQTLAKANDRIKEINIEKGLNTGNDHPNLLPWQSIWAEMETAKNYSRMYEKDPLARVSQDLGAPLCRDGIEAQMLMLSAKYKLLEIPIVKYLHKEVATIVQENEQDKKNGIGEIMQIFQAEESRPKIEQNLALTAAYAEAGKIIPYMWEKPGNEEEMQKLSAINDELSSMSCPESQLIPTGPLQNAIVSINRQGGLNNDEGNVEVIAFAKALLRESLPVYDWMPKRLHDTNPKNIPPAPSVTVPPGPMDVDGSTEALSDSQGAIVPNDDRDGLTEALSDSQGAIVPNDDRDGLTIYGKVVYAMKYGGGARVFVNFGTKNRPIYDVYPGKVFGSGLARIWATQTWDLPEWHTWKKDESVAAVHDMMYANGDHTYFLVAKGKPGEAPDGGKSIIVPIPGKKFFCSKTQLKKLMNQASFEDMLQKITVESEKNYAYSQHCQKNDLNPDTGNPLTDEEKKLMPWLAVENYKQDGHTLYTSEPEKRKRKTKIVQVSSPALEMPDTATPSIPTVAVPAAPSATLNPVIVEAAPAAAPFPSVPAAPSATLKPVTTGVAPATVPPNTAPSGSIPAEIAPAPVTSLSVPPTSPAAVTQALNPTPISAPALPPAQLSPAQLMSMVQNMFQTMAPDARTAFFQSMVNGPAQVPNA